MRLQGHGRMDAAIMARVGGLALVEGAALGWWFVLRPQLASATTLIPMWALVAAIVAATVVAVSALVLVASWRLVGRRDGLFGAAYVAGALAGLLVGYLVQPIGGPV